jgi:hypothetical protein
LIPKSPGKGHCEIDSIALGLCCFLERVGVGLFIKFVGVFKTLLGLIRKASFHNFASGLLDQI